jgi:hypothetical protein
VRVCSAHQLTRKLRKVKEKAINKGKWAGRGGPKGAQVISEMVDGTGETDQLPFDRKVTLPDEVRRSARPRPWCPRHGACKDLLRSRTITNYSLNCNQERSRATTLESEHWHALGPGQWHRRMEGSHWRAGLHARCDRGAGDAFLFRV